MDAMSQTCAKIIINPLRHESLAQVKPIPQTKMSLNAGKERCFAASRCVASGSGYAAAVEPITPEEEEELTQRRGICSGEVNRGVGELLECLEKEAIMGDDDGRDPKDYNRRAKIFDKSSKIFKNVKEQRGHSAEYVVKKLDNAESVTLQYRSLAKVRSISQGNTRQDGLKLSKRLVYHMKRLLSSNLRLSM